MSEQNLKNKTAKGLFWSGLSSMTTQILNMLFGVVIARILLPEDYGMVGMLLVFSGIASTLQESGLTSALINKTDCSHTDYNAVFWFNTLVSICIYLVLFFCSPLIAAFYHVPELKNLGRIVFLGFVFSALGTVPSAILLKSIQSKKLAVISFLSTVLAGMAGIIMAKNGLAYWGLAIQSVGMMMSRTVFLWYETQWKPSFQFNFKPLKPMLGFGIKILLTRIFDVITANILAVFLGKFFSKTAVGYYNQANKWNYMAYSTLVSVVTSISQPVFVQAADTEERSRRVLRKITRFMAFVSFPFMFGLSLIAPEFIVIMLTDKWSEAIPLLRILCIGGAFTPVLGIYSNFILSRGKSNLTMINAIAMSIAQLGSAFFFRSYGIGTMSLAFVMINIAWIPVWQLQIKRENGLRIREMLEDLLPFVLIAAFVMTVCYFAANPIPNIYLRITAKIILYILLYAFFMRVLNVKIYLEFKSYILLGIQKLAKKDTRPPSRS